MTTTEAPTLLIERQGPIGIVTFNNPDKMNAMSPGMSEGLQEFIRSVEADPAFRVMILTGKGRGFCVGMDLSNTRDPNEPRPWGQGWPRPRPEMWITSTLRNTNFPIIGAINGAAAGAGLGLALATDLRIASEQARFISVFVRRGLMPDMGTNYLLQKIVGAQKALELSLTGDTVDAQEALRLGMVLKVVPQEQLMEEALALAERLAKGPPIAIAQMKRAVYRAESSSLEQDIELVSYAQQRCMATEDFVEGSKAFVEKREPIFRGK